jgi:hypothetical protein
MAIVFPSAGKLRISPTLAATLLHAAERLPGYDNKDYYSLDLQNSVRKQIRSACPDDFDWIIHQIRKRIAQRPYCAILQGLRYDAGNRLFVAINSAFGPLVARPYNKPRAQLVHYIQPTTDLKSSQGNHFETERLHTDAADWETPVKLISMLCVRADLGGGGRSLVLDINTLRTEARNRLGAKTLELLENTPVPWKLASFLGGGLKWRCIFNASKLCWRRYTIDLSEESITGELLAALDGLEEVIASTPDTYDFILRKGELLFLDNHRTLHARTPITGEGMSHRLMIRSWINEEDNE